MPIERLYVENEEDRRYKVLAGKVEDWEEEMKRLIDDGESLLSVQRDQYERGFRQVEIVKVSDVTYKAVLTINPSGGKAIIVGNGTLRGVIEQAKKWSMEDEKNREVIIKKELLNQ